MQGGEPLPSKEGGHRPAQQQQASHHRGARRAGKAAPSRNQPSALRQPAAGQSRAAAPCSPARPGGVGGGRRAGGSEGVPWACAGPDLSTRTSAARRQRPSAAAAPRAPFTAASRPPAAPPRAPAANTCSCRADASKTNAQATRTRAPAAAVRRRGLCPPASSGGGEGRTGRRGLGWG